MSSGSNLNEDRPIGTGIDLVTGILSSFLSGEKNNVNIGVNYNNQDREYSVDAQVNLYNDKLLLKTNLGMGYDKYVESNSFIGEASLRVPINDSWDFEAFYFYDPTNAIDISKSPQGGGISFKYRQDFNNGKDFAESWKVKKKDKAAKKVDVSNQNNNE